MCHWHLGTEGSTFWILHAESHVLPIIYQRALLSPQGWAVTSRSWGSRKGPLLQQLYLGIWGRGLTWGGRAVCGQTQTEGLFPEPSTAHIAGNAALNKAGEPLHVCTDTVVGSKQPSRQRWAQRRGMWAQDGGTRDWRGLPEKMASQKDLGPAREVSQHELTSVRRRAEHSHTYAEMQGTHTHIYTYACTHKCAHTCRFTQACTGIHMYQHITAQRCFQIDAHHAGRHTCTHTQRHTYTQTQMSSILRTVL